MVKFLLTADWQIGMEAASLGEKAEVVRKARLDTLSQIVQTANKKDVDFVIVAGDAFEGNDIPTPLIHKVHQILENLDGIPVYFLPGNHDYFCPASVYQSQVWKDNEDRFKVLSERKPLELESYILYPSPICRSFSLEDPTCWIKKEETRLPRIGIAHGSLGILSGAETMEYPIAVNSAEAAGLDFLCLGHWHSYLLSGTNTLYPGTPETTAFNERDSGHIAIVEVEKGEKPVIEKVHVGTLTWSVLEKEINSATDLDVLKKELKEAKEPKRTLLHLTLTGMIPPALLDTIDDLKMDLEERYLYSSIDTDRVLIDDANTDVLELAPPGPIRDVVEELLKEARWNPAARSAIRNFIQISRGVGK